MYQASARRAHGAIINVGPSGAETHVDTKQCVHCGEHFPYQKGSGRLRGFCMRCMDMTCGSHRCMECFPIEERMALYEKGLLPELMSPREEIGSKKRGGIILP